LTALKLKGETPDEIAGLARGMKKAANMINPHVKGTLVDTCGTGGDSTGTINVSTGAAIVAAGAGVPIAKHGNYSITSKSGSADVLRELGIRIDMSPKDVEKTIENVGIGFMLALFSILHETSGADKERPGISNSIQYPWTPHEPGRSTGTGDGCFRWFNVRNHGKCP